MEVKSTIFKYMHIASYPIFINRWIIFRSALKLIKFYYFHVRTNMFQVETKNIPMRGVMIENFVVDIIDDIFINKSIWSKHMSTHLNASKCILHQIRTKITFTAKGTTGKSLLMKPSCLRSDQSNIFFGNSSSVRFIPYRNCDSNKNSA